MMRNGQVEFRFFRLNVKRVTLVGDFNAWDEAAMPMNEAGDGWWTARVHFDPGDYRFRYLADGQWFSDYAAFGLEFTRTGCNSILLVPQTHKPTQGRTNLQEKLVA